MGWQHKWQMLMQLSQRTIPQKLTTSWINGNAAKPAKSAIATKERKNSSYHAGQCGRGGSANDLSLALAFEEKTDIFLIQEPWVGAELDRGLSKKYGSYQAYAPEDEWKEHPIVVTYVRRQNSLWSVEKRQDILRNMDKMPDILVLEVKPSQDKEPIYILNVCNAPIRSKRAGNSAETVMQVTGLLRKRALIMGDINLHHTGWDNRTVNPTAQAKNFAEKVANKNATYGLEPVTVTHKRGGALDLVISSSPVSELIAESYVEPNLHVTSDYETILTCLQTRDQKAKKPYQQKFHLDKIDEKRFFISLEAQKDLMQRELAQAKCYSSGNAQEALDRSKEVINLAIYSSLEFNDAKNQGIAERRNMVE